eukprot:12429083-Karenia_brevis.AAC.1
MINIVSTSLKALLQLAQWTRVYFTEWTGHRYGLTPPLTLMPDTPYWTNNLEDISHIDQLSSDT